jgi:hypothetical protein
MSWNGTGGVRAARVLNKLRCAALSSELTAMQTLVHWDHLLTHLAAVPHLAALRCGCPSTAPARGQERPFSGGKIWRENVVGHSERTFVERVSK